MKETEKIEIMHFSQEGYLEDGKNVYETGKKMTALADKVADEGYDAVFLMGVGGTWDELMQLEYLMNKFGDRDLEVYLIHAAEWNVMGHKRMTEKSVVLTASESGTTPEVLEAVKKMKGMGVRVYAMTKPEGPIGQAVGAENCVMMASDHAPAAARRATTSPTASACACSTAAAASPVRPVYRADQGRLEGHARHPQALRAARRGARPEVRPGPLHHVHRLGRPVGRDDPVLDVHPRGDAVEAHPPHHLGRLLPRHPRARGAGRPRVPVHGRGREPQARRARPRLPHPRRDRRHRHNVIIDTAEYAIPGLDDDFRVIVSPWILSVLTTDRLARNYELVTKHNLKYRRYYHQFDY